MTDATTAESRVAHLLALHRLDEAERTARAALTVEPQDPGLLAALAAVLLAAGRTTDGLAAADAAVRLAPHDARAQRVRALLLSALGRHGEAVIPADEAAELAPHDVLVAVDQAWVLRQAHRFEEAERAARRAVALDPASADAHVALAGALAARGERDGARKSYAEALRLDPAHTAARHDLALLDAREHRPVRALGGLVDAGAQDPTASQILITAGRVVDALMRRLQRVLIVAVAGLSALGWSIPTGNPSRAVAGVVLGVAAVLVGWTARRLPRGSWPVVRGALSADAGAWATTTAVVLCLATFAVVAVAGFQVASAALAFVLGFGALGLLYAVGVFGALGVRWAHRRLRHTARG